MGLLLSHSNSHGENNSLQAAFYTNSLTIQIPVNNNNNNNNNNTYIALIHMRSKRFTSIVLQYDLEI